MYLPTGLLAPARRGTQYVPRAPACRRYDEAGRGASAAGRPAGHWSAATPLVAQDEKQWKRALSVPLSLAPSLSPSLSVSMARLVGGGSRTCQAHTKALSVLEAKPVAAPSPDTDVCLVDARAAPIHRLLVDAGADARRPRRARDRLAHRPARSSLYQVPCRPAAHLEGEEEEEEAALGHGHDDGDDDGDDGRRSLEASARHPPRSVASLCSRPSLGCLISPACHHSHDEPSSGAAGQQQQPPYRSQLGVYG
ncbi:hypothetical protein CDD83_10678 [Cordyceps sp. RAO-2017]|nr:hypothetical protein CDD83_10678 [Cordyceps sp. RAO-2017]